MYKRQTEDLTAERFRAMKIASDELVSTRRDFELKILSLQVGVFNQIVDRFFVVLMMIGRCLPFLSLRHTYV